MLGAVQYPVAILLFAASGFASGATLGLFRISRLKLEIEIAGDHKPQRQNRARKLLALRKDSNFLLAALLVLNVAVNEAQPLVLHSGGHDHLWWTTLLAWSISFAGILVFGEALPLAISNNRRVDTTLVLWIVKTVKVLTFPIAWPLARFLDFAVGPEVMAVMEERDLVESIRILMTQKGEIARTEGNMAINAFEMDDIFTYEIGRPVIDSSIISIPIEPGSDVELCSCEPFEIAKPCWPEPGSDKCQEFVAQVKRAKQGERGVSWIIITDESDRVNCVLHRADFLEGLQDHSGAVDPGRYCHLPIVVSDKREKIGDVLRRFRISMKREHHENVVLYWNTNKVIITGSDIQRAMLKGVAVEVDAAE